MNTDTVLQIINMLDNKLISHACVGMPSWEYVNGYEDCLKEIRDHLQEAIESQVNQAENDLQGSE